MAVFRASRSVSHRLTLLLLLAAACALPSIATSSAAQVAAAQPAVAPVASSSPDVPRPPARPALGTDGDLKVRVSFDEAIRRALARNPTALQAAEEIRRYHALMEEVRTSSLPTLAGIGTYTKLDAARTSNGVVVTPDSALNLNLTLNVPLIAPHAWVQWGQASDQVDVARFNAADVRRTIAVSTARAYLAVVTQKRLLETAISARDNAKGHYEFTRAQLVGGVGNRLDMMRAAQELATDESNLQRQESSLFLAREALGVLVAGDAPVDVAEEPSFGAMPSVNDGLNAAEKDRPDVRARKRAASASERAVREAWADYTPYLNLIASPFYENPPSATYPQTGWQAQLILTVPLYDGGLRYGQEHEKEALAEEARLSMENTLRQAKSDVRTAFEELERADIALDQAQQAAAFAKTALDLANLAYKAGATTNLEVIDAERQARDANNNAAIAEDASRQARVDLLSASGRFP